MSTKAPDPETGDEKEVYAFYGLASFTAQSAERGLMQLVVLLNLRKTQDATQANYDEVYEATARLPFGKLLKKLSHDETLEGDLRSLLKRALDMRNHLVHHFFWDYAEELFSEEGRLRMIGELQRATALFSEVDEQVVRVVESLGKELGVTARILEETFARLLADAQVNV